MAQPADDWIVPTEAGASAPAHAPGDDWIVPDADKPSGLQRARDALTPAPMQRVETAIGQGEAEGFGNEPLGITPGGDSEKELQKTGLLHTPGQPFEPVQAVTDFAIRHGAEAGDAAMRALNAGAHGIAAGAGQVAREFGQNEAQSQMLSGDIETAEDLALMAHIPERDLIANAAPPRLSSPDEIAAFNRASRAAPGAEKPFSQTRADIDEFLRTRAEREAASARDGQLQLPPPDDWVTPQETAAAPEPEPQPSAPAGTAAADTAFPSFDEPGRTAPPPAAEIPSAEPPPEPQAPAPRTDVGRHVLQALLDDPRSAAEIRGANDAEKAAAGRAAAHGTAAAQTGVAPQIPGQTPIINQVSHETSVVPPGTRDLPVALEGPEHVLAGAEHTAEPTPGQAEAGNYRKRHVTWNGLDLTVETEAGMARRGTGADGQPWSVTLTSPYGYIKGTKGRDGEQVDVYLGPQPQSPHVFIVDQIDPATGRFDEHKALVGFPDEASARAAYAQAFSDNSAESRLGALQSLTVEGFKDWLKKGARRQPLAYSDPVRAAEGIAHEIGLNVSPVEAEAAAHIQKVNNADPTDAVVTVIDHQALAALDAAVETAKKDGLTDAWTAHPETEDQAGAGVAPAGEQPAQPESAPAQRVAAPRLEPGEGEQPQAVATGEAAEHWWDHELTTAGRADLLKQIGIKKPPRVKWRYLDIHERAKLLTQKPPSAPAATPKPVHENPMARAGRMQSMGRKAFADGLPATPPASFWTSGSTTKDAENWARGWHAANAAAPVPEAEPPVTRDEAPAEPDITPLVGATAAALTKLIPKIAKMSAADRADIRQRIDAMMTDMEAEGRKIAEHCLETGGKFSVRR